ncbi:MAG TPA: beta-propeller fold lactonase family protein [Candidatus Acidoferrum sp.]|nr:beta-propeller fold lactonase family protein [Candidatus Acidoferrum sp.]
MTTVRRSIQPIHRLSRLLLAITTALVLNSLAFASLSASAMASGGQIASAPAITPQFVYVGNHDSKDLSVFHINAATGELSPIAGSPFRLETAPTSVVASPNGEFLFVAGDTSAGVFAYRIDSRGAPQAVEDSPFETSEGPHQFVVDHSGNHLYATSKESGSVLAFAIDAASGKLTAIAGSPFSAGRAPSGIAISPDDRFLFVSSAAENTIFSFRLNRQSGALAPTGNPAVETGVFPERMSISASGKELYVTNEGSDSVSAFVVDPADGALTPADGSPFPTLHSPGDLLVTAAASRLLVASSQAAGFSAMAIHFEDSLTAGKQLLAPGLQIASQGSLTLASDATGHFLFTANADSNTVTRYLIDPQTHNLGVNSGLSYATESRPRAIAIVNTVQPPVTESISVSLASGSLLTFSSTSGTVTLSAAAVQGSDSSCLGQVIQLAFSVPSIGVISTATENPATSVCVLTSQTTASFTVTTAAHSGSATLTAFATGFTDGTTTLSVNLRAITLSLPYTNIGTGNTVTGTVKLANPAPTAGTTISLSSSAAATASVAPASVVIAAGGTTANFTVTGVQANTATLRASVTSGGYSDGTIGVTVFPPGLTISLPHNAVVAPGQSLPYPISIGAAATAAVSIKLVGSVGPGTVTFSPNPIMIPIGATSPTTSPTITGVHIGPLSVTGSATGYAADTESATVQITLTFNPNTLSVETGARKDLTLSASAVAPTGGFKITLISADPTKATVAASITIPAGSSSVSVPITGVAAGSTTIQATAPGAIAGFAAITVYSPPGITIFGPSGSNNFTVGYNGVVALFGSLAVAAPANNLTVTLVTPTSSSLLLSTNATTSGSHRITLTVPAGSTSIPSFYAAAKTSSGSAAITASAPAYSSGSATATFAPSGFILQGGTTTTSLSGTSPVYVYFAQLDPTTLAYTGQTLTLRTGAPAVTIGLTNTDTPAGVGTLGASSVVLKAGHSNVETTFQPAAGGSATIGFAGTPTGYSAASNDKTTTFTVTTPNTSLILCNIYSITGTGSGSIGYNSACASSISLATAAPIGGRKVTLTSNSANLLLSTSATTVGSASIVLNVPAGSTTAPQFYAQALASIGSGTITETVPGYNSTTATVNFVPSGFIVQGGTSTTTFSGTSPVYVYFAQLDPTTLAYSGQTLTLRPGAAAATVGLKNTDTPAGVGTLASSSLVFNPGDTYHQTTFQPASAGSAVIGFSTTLSGYSTPSNYTTTTFTVTAPNTSLILCNIYSITGTGAGTIGYNSACASSISLFTAAPTGGRTLTLTSSDTSKLLLSNSATTVGSQTITLTVAAGSTTAPQFYAQALVSTGTATITESVSGYNPTAATVNFVPSGFILQGGTSTTTFSGTSPVYVYFAQLDPTTLSYSGQTLTLRPGAAAATVGLTNTDTPAGVGTLGSSSLVFNPGDTYHQTTFQPAKAGSAVVGFSGTLAGYSKPSNYNTTTFTVTAPNSSVILCNIYSVTGTGSGSIAYNSACASSISLAIAAPTGGRTVTLTSNSANLLLSNSATTVGSATITLSVAAGSTTAPQFYAQALASSGSATITETVPGYNSTIATVNFVPSGFILQGGTSTTSLSAASPVYVYFAQLDPSTLAYTGQALTLRPGASMATVGLTSTENPAGVGTLASSSLVFNSGDTSHQTTFQPAKAGSAVIGFSSTLAGYSTPSTDDITTFTVTAPTTSVQAVTVGNYMETTTYGNLQVPAPSGGATVTITAPSSGTMLLSTSASVKGSSSLSFTLAASSSGTPTFYVQSQGGGAGTVNLTISASGYANGIGVVTVYPSGFALQGSNFTTHLTDNPTTLTIVPAALDPTFLNIYQVQELVPNVTALMAPVTPTGTLVLTVQSGTPPVGAFSLQSVTFHGDDNPNFLTSSFEPESVGTALITITSPAPFSNASTEITATVVSP